MPRFNAIDYIVYHRRSKQAVGRYPSYRMAHAALRDEAAFTDRLESDFSIRAIDLITTDGAMPNDLDYSTF